MLSFDFSLHEVPAIYYITSHEMPLLLLLFFFFFFFTFVFFFFQQQLDHTLTAFIQSFLCNSPAFTQPTSSPNLISQTVTIFRAGKAGQMGQGRATPSSDEKRLLGDFQ